jgi:hypothetical protein
MQRCSLQRQLNEGRGYVYSYRGIRFGRLTEASLQAPKEKLRFGEKLPRMMGIKLPPRVRPGDTTRTYTAANAITQEELLFSPRTLGEDMKRHAQLRARITLNRAAFNAVRAQHSTDPLAPRLCRQCPATPPETARHVLVSCPRYAAGREELKKKLHATIEKIRKAKNLRVYRKFRDCIDSEEELLFHVILATPFVLKQLPKLDDRLSLLHETGNFLLYIHDIRPT